MISIVAVDDGDNAKKTKEQYQQELQELYELEDNTGRTFALAGELRVMQVDVWEAMELANTKGQRELLHSLRALRTDIREELEWPIGNDEKVHYGVREIFDSAMNRYRDYRGNEVMRSFILRLQTMAGIHLE